MNNNARKTGLFLMELIIAILFFSLAAAICIQLFVKSHMISERSIALNHSILLAQNTAEIFHATNGDPEKMASLLGCGESSGTAAIADSDNASTLTLFYTERVSKAYRMLQIRKQWDHLSSDMEKLKAYLAE